MQDIQITITDQIARVQLNRPELKNCVSLAMWQELKRCFDELSKNSDVRCVILSGAGGNFCSGADISEFGEVRNTAEQVHFYEAAVDAANDAIMDCAKPVVAEIEGYCVGGGLGLAMACDFRVATKDCCFFIPAAKMSIVYGLRETQNLLALVGLTHAKRILYTGERMNTERALAIGLVDIQAADSLQQAIDEFCAPLVAAAPLTVSGSKAILNSLEIAATDKAVHDAEALIKAAGESEDYREGRLAFAEKRAPVFKGC
ncbi:enoyl-CoA hydratase-related protein [Maricurvus nonylphenolicus]|uniref:enoyl-CoA hydratase-related protein n=1 Tax=Maricurvus nonylphenolicus TaxID=1008307 RepID=UPI0036F3AF40